MSNRRDRPTRHRLLWLVGATVVLLGVGGCTATHELDPRAPAAWEAETVRHAGDRLAASAADEPHGSHIGNGDTSRSVIAGQPEMRAAAGSPVPRPLDLDHPRVGPFVRHYARRDPELIERSLRRAGPYMRMIRDTLAHAGVPHEIAYLPIIESKFEVSARSRAGATGMWQFMAPTGRRYGLEIDRCVDERQDPVLSTRAAARYLAELYEDFGDWHLALAAYNAGESRIRRIMHKNGVGDYWSMVDRGLLPRETAHFVPRLLAVATIVENADAYGLTTPQSWPAGDPTVTVEVDAPISLKSVAKLAGLDRATVEALNPALQCKRVPRGGYDVRLPRRNQTTFTAAYAALDPQTILRGDAVHRVRRGENPGSIARLYGVSVSDLMAENGIRDPRRLRVDTELRIPNPI